MIFQFFIIEEKIKKKIKVNNNVIEEEIEGEIDLIIQDNGILYPIEIKETKSPYPLMSNEFNVLDKIIDKKRCIGFILCMIPEKIYLRNNLVCLPIKYI